MKHWNKDNRKIWWSSVHCGGPWYIGTTEKQQLEWQLDNRKEHWSSVHCGDPWYIGSQSLAADTRPVLATRAHKRIVDVELKHWSNGQQRGTVKLCPLWGPVVHWNNGKTTIGTTIGQQKGTVKLCPRWGSMVRWNNRKTTRYREALS